MNSRDIHIRLEDLEKSLPEADAGSIHDRYLAAVGSMRLKVVVLDDDPTGTQVVHDVPVYTQWQSDVLCEALRATGRMFFILTNSRGMTESETIRIHREIAQNLIYAMRETGQKILLISRSDSTLRGHFPVETAVINEEWTAGGIGAFDGEIILPFFPEGGRYTIGNTHYVEQHHTLIPVAETEFAKDSTFPFHHSDLCEWIEEKTNGAYPAKDVCCFSVDELRTNTVSALTDKLMKVTGFGKIVVNAVSYTDLELFAIPLMNAVRQGKKYLFRSAAAITKVLGLVQDREPLRKDEIKDTDSRNGGLIVVGSHVQKTTQQLSALLSQYALEQYEFDVRNILNKDELEDKIQSLAAQIDHALKAGKNTVLYTSRQKPVLPDADQEAELLFSVSVSDALAEIVRRISVRPCFLLAKGGITSSDIATKSLQIKQATVIGQILKGVPVWKAGRDSRFPGLPYIIFPGNVGSQDSLAEAYSKLL